MRVSHYFEWERFITGGHSRSVENQRTVMDERGIDYTTVPDLSADVLHLNNMGPRSIYYARRARRRDVPVVVHAHQTAEDFVESFALSNALAGPMRPYLEYAYSLADVLVCPSEHNRRVVESYAAVPNRVISNGVDPEKLAGYEALREEYLDRYDLEPPVAFTVGHVIERKGLSTFVETARRMPDVDFAWFGYLNPTAGPLGRLLRSRGTTRLVESAPDNCTFTGYVEDVRGAFAAGDVFFFPSKNENEGMALLEAMSCGTPPVVRDIGTYEWLTEGETCRKASDVDGFEAALRSLLGGADERERIGENARAASQAFTLEAVGDDLFALYRDVVAETDGGDPAGENKTD